MKAKRARCYPGAGIAFLFLGLTLVASRSVRAADFFWTNAGNAGNFTNAAIWATNGVALNTVPGAADNANFTNQISPTVHWTADTTASNAFFNAPGGTVSLNISNQTWSVLNSVVVGQNAGATASVTMISGQWIVTNATRTGSFILGGSGKGTLTLNGGTITVDQFVATNNGVGYTNSTVVLQSGTLTTLRGVTLFYGSNSPSIGSAAPLTWNMTGGTNLVTVQATTLGIGSGVAPVILNVSGADTVFTNAGGAQFNLGNTVGKGSQLNVTTGAQVFLSGNFKSGYNSQGAANTKVLVDGSNSLLLTAGTMSFGHVGSNSALVISGGGSVVVKGSGSIVGDSVGATNSSALVTGSGSLWTNAGDLYIGLSAPGAQLTISNGGTVINTIGWIGGQTTASNAVVLVTDPGSLWRNTTRVQVGTNGVGPYGKGLASRILVQNGGTLESAAFYGGLPIGGVASGVISNLGGIYQFTTATPTIAPGTPGAIMISNGWIAFRGIANANVQGSLSGSDLTNMVFSGANIFRLNNASNFSATEQSYRFNDGISPSNYVGLEMINGGTAWKSAWLDIGSGGSLLVSNTAATIAGTLTNSGAIRVVNAAATWQSNVTLIGGSFTLRDATNTFASALRIESGAHLGGSGRIENNAAVTNLGVISPGNSPGTLTFSSDLTLLGSSVLQLEIASTNGADYDHLVVEGVLTRGGTILVTNLGWTFAAGNTFDFWNAAAVAGSFLPTNTWGLPALDGGLFWDTSLFESEGILSVAAIPEPRALLALAAGLCALVLGRGRRKM